MVQPMRSLALVLTIAFVFASSALLAPAASAQGGSGSINGIVCVPYPGDYPKPASPESSGSSACDYSQGLPGATVTLSRAGVLGPIGGFNESRTTDDSGSFSFTGLQSGDYTLRVERTGFDAFSSTVTIGSSAVRRDVELTPKTVSANGKVADGNGAGIANAEVQLCCGSSDQLVARTGSDGRFAANVLAGWWSLYIQAPGFQAFSDYRLVDGSEITGLVLQPVPPTDAVLRGLVTDQDGAPVAQVRVSAYSYGGCYYASDAPASDDGSEPSSVAPCDSRSYYGGENFTFTGLDGRYTLGVYSGQGSLSVAKDGYASYNLQFGIAAGETQDQDLTIKKFPEKTAHIVGRVTHDGDGVRYASLSVNSPEFGIYECSSEDAQSGGGSSGSSGSGSTEPGVAASSMPYPGPSACAISIDSSGRFDGYVTPGYAIVSVYVDSYRACAETRDSDGSFSSSCGPEYYTWSRSLTLPEDAETRLDISLRARPAPDAVVSGYLIDAESGEAIPGAQISFSNLETYGYGYATTDSDGSYKLRLRSGYHQVYAYAEGHLHWEGTLMVARGDSDLDVELQPGQESYGYCCWAYAEGDKAASQDSAHASGAPSAMSGAGDSGESATGDSEGMEYIDLGGGLGPYDASKREQELSSGGDSNGAPGPGLALLAAALAGAAFVLRRRKA